MGRNTTRERVQTPTIETVELPTPEEAPVATLVTEEDVKLQAKHLEALIREMNEMADAEEAGTTGDEKSDAHRAANAKGIRDAIAKLNTVQKRHGWIVALLEKATRAQERAAKAEEKRLERERKAEEKLAAAEKAAAEKPAKAAPKAAK